MRNDGAFVSVFVEEYSERTSCITHSGVFHADEVLGTVILEEAFGDITVARVSEVPTDLPDSIIVYDIGRGKFDHHQPGGNGRRENGVAYASAGLLWKAFGDKVVEGSADPGYLWAYVDESLIQGVDAADNGDIPTTNDMNRVFSFTKMIAGFNPEWDNEKIFDQAFLEAVEFAKTVFDNVITRGNALIKAKGIVERAIGETAGQIMVLEKPVPWKDALLESDYPHANDILFVIYPSERGGYVWQGVPDELGSYGQRKMVPDNWRGLSGDELRKATGVPTAVFCHQKGFAGSAETLEDAILFAAKAIET